MKIEASRVPRSLGVGDSSHRPTRVDEDAWALAHAGGRDGEERNGPETPPYDPHRHWPKRRTPPPVTCVIDQGREESCRDRINGHGSSRDRTRVARGIRLGRARDRVKEIRTREACVHFRIEEKTLEFVTVA